jgi:hypothetical protein
MKSKPVYFRILCWQSLFKKKIKTENYIDTLTQQNTNNQKLVSLAISFENTYLLVYQW